MNELSQDRQNALELARVEGWRVSRDGKRWKFMTPDTGGLWDCFYISHAALSVSAVFRKIEAYNEELGFAVSEARNKAQTDWLKEAHPRLYAQITEGGAA